MKPGYKQTEVGVIPEDWEVVRLREQLSAQPRSGVNASSCPFDLRLPTYIRITDIDSAGRFNTEGKTSVDTPFAGEFRVETGDLLFARTGATVGKCYLHRERTGDFVYAGFLIRVHTKPASLDPEFLFYFCQSRVYWRWVASDSARTGQPGLNGRQYGGMLLPLPSIEEQRAIAEALSDADALIESLEALIAKKRQVKQGAMQELLTGKRRLPGFSGDWETATIGDIASRAPNSIVGGPFGSDLVAADYVPSGVPVIRGQNMSARRVEGPYVFVSHDKAKALSANLAHANDLILTQRGTLGQVAVVPSDEHESYLVSQSQMKVSPNAERVSTEFLYHLLTSVEYQRILVSSAIQTGVPHLNLGILRALKIRLPGLAEQRAIAEFLSDLDSEVEALDTKLEKARAIKQGMMQELLTGRTRLVPAEVS